jgi:hypothetical protein
MCQISINEDALSNNMLFLPFQKIFSQVAIENGYYYMFYVKEIKCKCYKFSLNCI